jgi:hypothetical protein
MFIWIVDVQLACPVGASSGTFEDFDAELLETLRSGIATGDFEGIVKSPRHPRASMKPNSRLARFIALDVHVDLRRPGLTPSARKTERGPVHLPHSKDLRVKLYASVQLFYHDRNVVDGLDTDRRAIRCCRHQLNSLN